MALELNQFYFQVQTIKDENIVVAYSDTEPEKKFLPRDTKIVISEVKLHPARYLGLLEEYLGADKIPDNRPIPTQIEQARGKAKTAYFDWQFAIDVEDPDVKDRQALYQELKRDYINLRDGAER